MQEKCIQLNGNIAGGRSVSLSREWIQGNKRMTMMYFMHGSFLTCTQKSHLYLHNMHSGIYTMYKQTSIKAPCIKKNPRFTYFEGQLLARGDEFPSTLVPSLVTTFPPLGFNPFHPFFILQFTLQYLLVQSDIKNHSLFHLGQEVFYHVQIFCSIEELCNVEFFYGANILVFGNILRDGIMHSNDTSAGVRHRLLQARRIPFILVHLQGQSRYSVE